MAVISAEVTAQGAYEGGRAFGPVGAYQRFDLRLHCAVDPTAAANRFVADLDLAQRDADGRVGFEVDACLLVPADPSAGNASLLTSVVNRGRMDLVPFSYVPGDLTFEVTDRVHPGDGFLLEQGWSLLFCGWQWDVLRRPGRLGAALPLAEGADETVTVQFQPNRDRHEEYLGHWPWHPRPGHPDRLHHAYPAADVDDPGAVLTERDWPGGPRRTVARDRWCFGRVGANGAREVDPCWVWSAEGFRAGVLYEVLYRTEHCPVVGLGMAGVRDVVSFLRHAPAEAGNPAAGHIRHSIGWGVSQTGRFLRDFLHDGANVDEAGRPAFDGLFVQIAGARRGEFNFRGAQPSAQYVLGPGHEPPYRHDPPRPAPGRPGAHDPGRPEPGRSEPEPGHREPGRSEPEPGRREPEPGLLDRQRAAGGVPRIFEVNTSNEYWRSDAGLVHLDPVTGTDVALPAEVRSYLIAGTQHVSGAPTLARQPVLLPEARTANWINQVAHTPVLHALLVDLHQWVVQGREPPASAVPSWAEGTAVPREPVLDQIAAAVGSGSGLVRPDPARLGEVGGPVRVPAVDDDGNERVGIRPVEVAVPLATHLGWNVRDPATGGQGQLMDMLGSSLPFPADEQVRVASGDPRRSIAARYRDRDDYLRRVSAAVDGLVEARFMLDQDRARTLATARRLYDLLSAPPG